MVDIDQNMTAQGKGLESATSGATISVPQVDPVFSFRTKGGDIYVYLVRTEIIKIAIMTFDDTQLEIVYGAIALTSSWESEHLVFLAESNYPFNEDNPFSELHKNEPAMQKLGDILAKVFYLGE